MAESVARSSTTSATSAVRQRASKKSVKAKQSPGTALLSSMFGELARLAEMSTVERKLRQRGFRFIAGTDEVGRGALAGPVVAAAVILEEEPILPGVDDSKRLDLEDRVAVSRLIMARALAFAVGVVEPHVIDRINILEASKLAMLYAVQNLCVRPEVLLLDAVVVERLEMPQVPIVHGDRRSVSIAAASVIAKVYRDTLMQSYHGTHPDFDFAHNRGYGTEHHLETLSRLGPTPIHRRSFLGTNEAFSLFVHAREDGGSAR